MKQYNLDKLNKLSKDIERLAEIKTSLNSKSRHIEVSGDRYVIVTGFKEGYSTHSEVEIIENTLVEKMKEAGLKYITKVLKAKQNEFEKL